MEVQERIPKDVAVSLLIGEDLWHQVEIICRNLKIPVETYVEIALTKEVNNYGKD